MPPILTPGLERLVAAVDALIAEDPFMLCDRALISAGETLATQQDRLDHVFGRMLNAMWSKESTVSEYGQSLKGWLVDTQHLSPAEAGRRISTARESVRSTAISDAHAAGQINAEHVRQIGMALRKLPPEVHEVAESELVQAAKHADPASLGRALRELEERLGCNESADERYARTFGSRYLKTSSTIDGMLKIDGMLDPVAAAAFKEALAPLRGKRGAEDDRSQAERDHDALADLVSLALKTDELPEHGGAAPQIVVTASLADLIDGLDRLHIPTSTIDGHPLPPATVRMLACDAGIIPVLMNGRSEVLDLGRSSRTWSKAQRLAARLRDGATCTWPGGCSAPIRYCHLHHLEFWAEHRGNTDHDNSAHVCTFHHWLVHNRNWKLWRNAAGVLECRRT